MAKSKNVQPTVNTTPVPVQEEVVVQEVSETSTVLNNETQGIPLQVQGTMGSGIDKVEVGYTIMVGKDTKGCLALWGEETVYNLILASTKIASRTPALERKKAGQSQEAINSFMKGWKPGMRSKAPARVLSNEELLAQFAARLAVMSPDERMAELQKLTSRVGQ